MHGSDHWALPGGHLEYTESFEDCAVREVLEETGISIKSTPDFAYAVNSVFQESGKHYVTIFMRANVPQASFYEMFIVYNTNKRMNNKARLSYKVLFFIATAHSGHGGQEPRARKMRRLGVGGL